MTATPTRTGTTRWRTKLEYIPLFLSRGLEVSLTIACGNASAIYTLAGSGKTYTLRNISSGKTYTLDASFGGGVVRCSCPDAYYRCGGPTGSTCKHVLAIRAALKTVGVEV